MIINILYAISNIMLLASFIRIKKTDKKLNFVHMLVFSIGLLFCYNAVIVYILSLLHIPIFLITIAIINITISFLLLKFNTEKQKYEYPLFDIIVLLFLVITVAILGVLRFGTSFNIVYDSPDSAAHFWVTKDFANSTALLNRTETTVDFSTRLFGSYTNLGLVFKTVEPLFNNVSLYKVYILYDLFMFLLGGTLFYVLLKKMKTPKVASLLATLFYLAGYPLNNLVMGFFHLGHGIIVINLLIILINSFDKKEISKKMFIALITIINSALFFTYYFFVPVVFISLFAYYIYKFRDKGKFVSKNFLLLNLVTLCLPFVFGFIYFIIPNLGNDKLVVTTQMNVEGLYYGDVLTNLILFIPIIIYYFLKNLRNKINFEDIMFIALILFMTFFTYLIFQEKAGVYYLSKNYYLLWLLCFVICIKALNNYLKKDKLIVISYSIFYIFMAIIAIFDIENMIMNKNNLKVNIYPTSNLLNVYRYNINSIKESEVIFNSYQIEKLEKINNHNPKNIMTNANYYQTYWLAAFFTNGSRLLGAFENELYTYIIDTKKMTTNSQNIFNEINYETENDYILFDIKSYIESNKNYTVQNYGEVLLIKKVN